MGRLSYVAVLAFVVVGSAWLEVVLRTRVLARWRRLLLTCLPVLLLFFAWDAYAIAHAHWHFDQGRILGVYLPAAVPLDEVLFFLVIPLAAILTLEAVRSVNPHWPVGDEAPAEPGQAEPAPAEQEGPR